MIERIALLVARASRTEEEEKQESRKGETETSEMADLIRRLNEIPDDDPFK